MTAQPVDSPDLWADLPSLLDGALPDVWEDPIPLSSPRKLAAFPLDALPDWLAEFVAAVAEETQTPADLAGCLALSVLATAAGGRSVVQVRGNWREPTNLYVAVALPPANRKSAVFALLSDPLFDAEKRLKELAGPAIIEAELTAKLAKEAADKATAKAASAKPDERDDLIANALGLAQTAESVTVPAVPQLLADDATAETVTSLLAEQGERISVMSAEGEIFDIMAGRYSSGSPNLGIFLKGHAGDRQKVNRQTRKEYIEHPAVTMGICVQPQVLEAIGRNEVARGRGLLGRFLYALPESLVGRRDVDPDPIPEPVKETYRRNVIDLTLFLADWTDPALIQLAPESVAALRDFQQRIEPRLAARSGQFGHIQDWAGKLAGATARIAALLHLAAHLNQGHALPVGEATMHNAIVLAEYFASHALAAFDAMGADPTTERARTVLEALQTHRWNEVSKRDLMVKLSRSEFPTAADLDPVLTLLEDHGYVRAQSVARTGGRGRPPSPRYAVHPRLADPTT
ncbi:YfjI family protein [Streptomyces sp. Qhu-G9]|uniref:YfjI family protein n=1 Tax=Streptomyces sp. Qhu-G9 TaxID=3452799 RepID=UPI0022AC463F|nr:YfjI family protein [Streptomyces aurantiacus]WAU84886.1 YfjI family protein [Streptomyces aurantiacus]